MCPMINRILHHFDLRQLADSGQCFRMCPLPGPGQCYTVISGRHFLVLCQDGKSVSFSCTEQEFPYWETYFDLQTDYAAFVNAAADDDLYLQKAVRFGSGIRILRQELWEMIITFLISQQKTIPNIRALVESLCLHYGNRCPIPEDTAVSFGLPDSVFYTFPTPEQLSRASLDDLQELKLGYRAKYIKRVCESACAGELDLALLKELDYPHAMKYLTGFYGIGEKVANCVCLFGLHQIEAFPVDTWIQKILLREYAPKTCHSSSVPRSGLCKFLAGEYFSRYQGFAGVMQQYIFYYERFAASDISGNDDGIYCFRQDMT